MFKQRQDYFRKTEKLRKENPNKFFAFTSDFDKLSKILTNAKDKIKNYFKTLVYLTPKDFKIIDNINFFRLDVGTYTIAASSKKKKNK